MADKEHKLKKTYLTKVLCNKVTQLALDRNGLIYFPEFCNLALEWFRETEEEEDTFRQSMFKVHLDLEWDKVIPQVG